MNDNYINDIRMRNGSRDLPPEKPGKLSDDAKLARMPLPPHILADAVQVSATPPSGPLLKADPVRMSATGDRELNIACKYIPLASSNDYEYRSRCAADIAALVAEARAEAQQEIRDLKSELDSARHAARGEADLRRQVEREREYEGRRLRGITAWIAHRARSDVEHLSIADCTELISSSYMRTIREVRGAFRAKKEPERGPVGLNYCARCGCSVPRREDRYMQDGSTFCGNCIRTVPTDKSAEAEKGKV